MVASNPTGPGRDCGEPPWCRGLASYRVGHAAPRLGVLTPAGWLEPGAVIVTGDRITGVAPWRGAAPERVSGPGFRRSSGQRPRRGGRGHAAGPTPWSEMDRLLVRQGVTTWFPTLVSGPLAGYGSHLDRLAQWAAWSLGQPGRAQIGGVHLEGPFLGRSPEPTPPSTFDPRPGLLRRPAASGEAHDARARTARRLRCYRCVGPRGSWSRRGPHRSVGGTDACCSERRGDAGYPPLQRHAKLPPPRPGSGRRRPDRPPPGRLTHRRWPSRAPRRARCRHGRQGSRVVGCW